VTAATATAATFAAERRRLLGLAYRVLGSMTDAEDVVQDAWLRWQAAGEVERPAAWLTTVVTRLAIDRLRSAQHQRESYVGPWLPEPVTADPDPAESAALADSLTLGFLTLLERLTPLERAVFLLADVFDEPFTDIATIVGKSPVACRQIASRARRRVRDPHRHVDSDAQDHERVAKAFVRATAAGDIEAMLALLAPDVVLVSDGGADHRAARHPVRGADRVVRLLANLMHRIPPDASIDSSTINGEPGIVLHRRGRPFVAVVFHVEEGRVASLLTVVNPAKLRHLTQP
jgi:RNA polymerase sigma-70 factor (ECF subfamily)